jgi:serine/threonine protein kinase
MTLQDSEAGAHIYALPAGTRLQNYRIDKTRGNGGFGITYIATDTENGETVAIKEYLPNEIAVRVSNSTVRARASDHQKLFNDGVFAFLEEAKRIARVVHPNIMEVKKFFTTNGTGYIALRYEQGETVKERLDKPIPEKLVRLLLDGILQGLIALHEHDSALLHRDIKPSNIILSRNRNEHQETPVLIDFGAAREFRNRHSQSVTALVSAGYSPIEQYGIGGPQGPWTDIYALGATAYRCVTKKTPPDSLQRHDDDKLVAAAIEAKGKYSDDLLRLIDWMIMVKPSDRPQSARLVLQALRSAKPNIGSAPRSITGKGLRAVSSDGPEHFVLQFERPPSSPKYGIAFKVMPPAKFLAPGTGSRFQDRPHFFKLDVVEGEQGQIGFRAGPDIRRRLRRGSEVAILSEDGAVDASVRWPLLSGAKPPGFGIAFIVATLLFLAASVAAAMNIGVIQDLICEKTGFCTAQQLLFKTTQQCVQGKPSCGIGACLGDFRNKAVMPRLIDRMTKIEVVASAACRSEDETEFNKATTCANQKQSTNICDVAACYASYQSAYPDGNHIGEARTAATAAQQACVLRNVIPTRRPSAPQAQPRNGDPQAGPPAPIPTPQPTAPAPAPATPRAQQTPPTPPAPPAVALPDGTYNAVRTFVEQKSTTDPLSCPPSTNLQVTVSGSNIRFESQEANTGITRKWKGNVSADGKITFVGSDATPPMFNYYTIFGNYSNAEINSKFCGKGYLKITR